MGQSQSSCLILTHLLTHLKHYSADSLLIVEDLHRLLHVHLLVDVVLEEDRRHYRRPDEEKAKAHGDEGGVAEVHLDDVTS